MCPARSNQPQGRKNFRQLPVKTAKGVQGWRRIGRNRRQLLISQLRLRWAIKSVDPGYRNHGKDSLIHGNRGRRPSNATSPAVAAKVIELGRDRYPDANHTHLAQLLSEREGLKISRQTLRRILAAAGLKSPRRRRPRRHRVRRERMPREGLLVQIDGSHHRWLGDDHPQLALHLAVDDATGKVLAARFRPDEDACGYFELLGDLIHNHGIPLALYSDRHSVFVPSLRSAQPKLAEGATQFARTKGGSVHRTRTPPAQHTRVERSAGAFQDRLVTEMRLDGVTTLTGANYLLESFIERFNRQFAVAPAQPQTARLRPNSILKRCCALAPIHRNCRDRPAQLVAESFP